MGSCILRAIDYFNRNRDIMDDMLHIISSNDIHWNIHFDDKFTEKENKSILFQAMVRQRQLNTTLDWLSIWFVTHSDVWGLQRALSSRHIYFWFLEISLLTATSSFEVSMASGLDFLWIYPALLITPYKQNAAIQVQKWWAYIYKLFWSREKYCSWFRIIIECMRYPCREIEYIWKIIFK